MPVTGGGIRISNAFTSLFIPASCDSISLDCRRQWSRFWPSWQILKRVSPTKIWLKTGCRF